MFRIDEVIKIVMEMMKDYKPDGIGGSCDCDACNDARIGRYALRSSLGALKTIENIDPLKVYTGEEIINIYVRNYEEVE